MSIADKLTTIAENEQKVYEAGKTAEWNDFWDRYQKNGTRISYESAFVDLGWTDDTFKPKYDIKVVGEYSGTQMFRKSYITDLRQRLIDCGVVLDLSEMSPFNQIFQNSKITHLPKIDMSGATKGTYTFYTSALKYIEELVVHENFVFDSTTFGEASRLTDITITGVIGTTLHMGVCPLTVESAKSVINALKNYAGTDYELTYTLTLKNTVWDALDEAEAPPTGETWKLYVNSLGWNCA